MVYLLLPLELAWKILPIVFVIYSIVVILQKRDLKVIGKKIGYLLVGVILIMGLPREILKGMYPQEYQELQQILEEMKNE